jgi:hypothetical protein
MSVSAVGWTVGLVLLSISPPPVGRCDANACWELDHDIRDHLERETQDNIERGMSPEEARRAALLKFGNVTRIKEETWEVWSLVWVEQLLQDARFGLRTLWRSPGLTIAAVLAIALGIGVNVGVVSVLNVRYLSWEDAIITGRVASYA